jgi:O-antigen ligase
MKRLYMFLKENFSYFALSVFLLFALFNPVFKKYDYGAGFPLLIIFGVLLFFIAIREFSEKRENSLLDKIFLFVFVGFFILSFAFSQTKNIGFSEVLAYSSMLPLYYFFAHKKNTWTEQFLKIVLFGAVVSVILGYFLYFYRAEPRLIGPFFNTLYHAHVWPNAFALFLLMCWPILILFYEKKAKWTTSLLIGFILSAILLTYSRGALIVLFGQFFLLLIYFFKRIRLRTVALTILALVFAVGIFFEANYVRSVQFDVIDFKERAGFENDESLTSKTERLDFWIGAIELTKEKPLFGWGPFSFRQAYNPIQKTFLGNADHPHNIFLKISSENGVFALVAFIGFLLTVFITVAKRFSRLSQSKKDVAYILGISIAGGFAHNLIDYNFNFIANLLLLFLFIIFLRSIVVIKTTKVRRSIVGFVFAFFIFVFCIYEGVLLTLSHTSDESYLEYSFFPRDYYLNSAEKAISDENYTEALDFIEHQLSLNNLDSQAEYLKGVVYCNQKFEGYDLETCATSFASAIKLNPMNEFSYYRDYLRANIDAGQTDSPEFTETFEQVKNLLDIYFIYVENNVHFTSYTSNVESASDVIDLISPYFSKEDSSYYLEKKDEMLETSERLRNSKTF